MSLLLLNKLNNLCTNKKKTNVIFTHGRNQTVSHDNMIGKSENNVTCILDSGTHTT